MLARGWEVETEPFLERTGDLLDLKVSDFTGVCAC